MRFFGILILLVVLYIFRSWFSLSGTLSSGDWPYLYLENIKEFSFLLQPGDIWLSAYYKISAKIFVEYLGFQWEFTERLVWFWPFLLLTVLSSYKLTKSWIGVLIYTANTYTLMLVGGGQMGVAMAYAIAPLVLDRFMEVIDVPKLLRFNFKFSIISSLILALQVMFDPRIAYITLFAVLLYFFIQTRFDRHLPFLLLRRYLFPICIAIVLNSFWIFGIIRHDFANEAISGSTKSVVDYFSFAKFSQALSLLHPNWPENIFGKTYFMRPEFLLLPIIAFAGLLFSRNSKILFFSLLGLLGAFLAKGSNPPFGQLYLWFFDNIPGFFLFRDSTKFYLLISLSYAALVPNSLGDIANWIGGKIKKVRSKNMQMAVHLAFLIYFVFTVREAFLSQLRGTFETRQVPKEYMELKEYLKTQPEFFYTLWVPAIQRFGFSSVTHRGLSSMLYFQAKTRDEMLLRLIDIDKGILLKTAKVKYIIIPYDSEGEIFQTDRVYDEVVYESTLNDVRKIPGLVLKQQFGQIVIFEVLPEN